MLIPAMRAMRPFLALALLMPGVLADHEHPAMTADDLALFTHRLDRRSYLHDPFRLIIQTGWLWRPGRPPLPCPRSGTRRSLPAPSATEQDSKGFRTAGPSAKALQTSHFRPVTSVAGCLHARVPLTLAHGFHWPIGPSRARPSDRSSRSRRAAPRRSRARRVISRAPPRRL